MADPDKGKYTRLFKCDWTNAQERLQGMSGKFIPGEHDYEAWRFVAPRLTLIFYPHTTKGTGNRHIRVRTQGAFCRKQLRKALFALAENSCTFQCPAHGELHQQAVTAAVMRENAALKARHEANK